MYPMPMAKPNLTLSCTQHLDSEQAARPHRGRLQVELVLVHVRHAQAREPQYSLYKVHCRARPASPVSTSSTMEAVAPAEHQTASSAAPAAYRKAELCPGRTHSNSDQLRGGLEPHDPHICPPADSAAAARGRGAAAGADGKVVLAGRVRPGEKGGPQLLRGSKSRVSEGGSRCVAAL